MPPKGPPREPAKYKEPSPPRIGKDGHGGMRGFDKDGESSATNDVSEEDSDARDGVPRRMPSLTQKAMEEAERMDHSSMP